MFRTIAALLAAAALAGCGTRPYQPQEYPLRDGLVPKLAVAGEVQVGNRQTSTAEAIVYSYGGTQLASNYKDITQLLVDQTKKELVKNGTVSPGKAKDIGLEVTYLQSRYIAFFWKSEIRFTATLGASGKKIEKTATHGSGSVIQDLNGCIAEGVIKLLNDPDVVTYLAE